VPGDLYHALATVPGLRRGIPGVRESKPVGPVNPAVVEATMPHLPRVIQAMIRVQVLSGARPGEVCLMRACDLDMTGPVWFYRPQRHKTEHHERQRVIPLGPQGQAVIRPFLTLNTQAYLFCPKDSEAARHARRRQNRKTPLTPSQRKRQPLKTPKRPKRDHYDETSYRNAVYRACHKAFLPPEPLAKHPDETIPQWLARLTLAQKEEVRQWQREHRWHPNQLRHTRGTEIRRRYGLEGPAWACQGRCDPGIRGA
jgi:integrase